LAGAGALRVQGVGYLHYHSPLPRIDLIEPPPVTRIERADEPVEPDGSAHAEKMATYQERAKLGTVVLALRTALSQVIILGGTVVLARQLKPSEFGTFAMVQFVLTVFTLVGDAGLGGALIQKSGHPNERELSTVFWAQLGLSAAVFAAVSGSTLVLPLMWPSLPARAPSLLLALGVNFIFLSLRVVPTILLERELHFVRLAIVDTLNAITFYLVASILALSGFGVWALVLGVLAQGVLGCAAAFALRPYRPWAVFDLALVKELLAFGLPFQARGALSLATRAVVPVVVGARLGSHAVGELNWAWETGFFALTFSDILGRVGFPLFSRIRHDRVHLMREVERTLRVGLSISSFLAAMFVGLRHPLTSIIYGQQWVEAENSLAFFAAALFLGVLGYILGPALDALGFPRLPMLHMGLIGAVAWAAAPLGLAWFGMDGFAFGIFVAFWSGGVLTVFFARSLLSELPLCRILGAQALATIATGAFGHYWLAPRADGPWLLTASVLTLLVLFVVLLLFLDRGSLRALMNTARSSQ
jgi:teichuronic acid exporter